MTKKRNFWLGIIAGFLIGFLYGWLSIWATYTALERQNRERETELEQVKRIIYFSRDILSQRKGTLEWNLETKLPVPEWAEAEGNQ